MDNFFEILVAVIFIVFSVVSEMAKKKKGDEASGNTGSSDSSGADLSAIEDFFRKQAEDQKAPGQTQEPSWGDTRASTASDASPFPPLPMSSDNDGDFLQPQKKAKKKKRPSQGQSSKESAQPIVSKRRPTSRGEEEHISDEGPCLDEGDSLTGKIDYEDASFGSLVGARSATTKTATLERRPQFRWTRGDVLRAVVFSELMSRYDLNRIYSRIPDQNRSS